MNKPIYLRLSILQIGKAVMYQFWYDYVKPKYQDNGNLCYTDTDSFTENIKIENVFQNISKDVERRFNTSNYEICRPLPVGKNKNKKNWINEG